MQKRIMCRFLLAVVLVFFVSGVLQGEAAKSKTAQPKTVVDYFMLLPQKFFEVEKAQRKAMLYGESGSIVDIKNDYIRMSGDGAQASLHLALFRYKGRVLVGLYEQFEGARLYFMRYENGKWQDVTKSMMPVPFNERYVYTLPRYGTTIKVTQDNGLGDYEPNGKKIYDLVWVQGKFKVRRN